MHFILDSEELANTQKALIWKLVPDQGFSFTIDNLLSPPFRQTYILQSSCLCEQRSNLPVLESGNSAAYSCNIEEQFGMFSCISDELIHVWPDVLDSTVHCRNGVTLSTMTYSASHSRSKFLECRICCSASVHSFQIAALCKCLHKEAYVKTDIM